MKALILSAGTGANLVPFTSTRPKSMVRIAGNYILEHILMLLRQCGINQANIVVGHMQNKIVDVIKDGGDYGMHIHYIKQTQIGAGIGDAIFEARNRFTPGEYFMLIYGDVLVSGNIFNNVLQAFGVTKFPVASVNLTPSPERFGNVYLDAGMKIKKIIEKPLEGSRGNYVLSGVFILPHSFFDLLKDSDKNMEVALCRMAEGNQLKASIWEGHWIDIVYPWDIITANQFLMDEWDTAVIDKTVVLNGNVRLEGPVRLEKGVEICSGTTIQGPAYIGRNSFIGNNSLIRKYTTIGPESTVGYGVEMKNCIMFGRSTVGRLSFIGDSVIGTGVDIGAGTMTINRGEIGEPLEKVINGVRVDTGFEKLGAFIGDDAIVGANNAIISGTIIEPKAIISHNHSYPV